MRYSPKSNTRPLALCGNEMNHSNYIETYYLGAYWRPQEESVASCAEKLLAFLRTIVTIDTMFENWFETGWSKREALTKRIDVNQKALELLLSTNNDKELGHQIGIWNGESDDSRSCGISVRCGCSNQYLHNSLIINLPYGTDVANKILTYKVLLQLMKATVDSWEPDWAVIMSNDQLDNIQETAAGQPTVGWFLYNSRTTNSLPDLPHPSCVTSFHGSGTLTVLTKDRFSARKPEHMMIVHNVSKILVNTKLLEPLF